MFDDAYDGISFRMTVVEFAIVLVDISGFIVDDMQVVAVDPFKSLSNIRMHSTDSTNTNKVIIRS